MTDPTQTRAGDKKKIVINGKEYASIDELPEDIRSAFQKAFRGSKTYNPQAGPPDFRELFNAFKVTFRHCYKPPSNDAKANVDAKSTETGDNPLQNHAPITPQSSLSSRKIYLSVGIIILIGLIYYYYGIK